MHWLARTLLFTPILSMHAVLAQPSARPPIRRVAATSGRALLDSAIHALSGTRSLASLQSLRIEGIQHEYILGNAERPDGPWRPTYVRYSELRDLSGPRMRRTETSLTAAATAGPRVMLLVDSVLISRSSTGQESSAGVALREDLLDRMDASPERALMLARTAEVHVEPSVVRYGLPRDVVSFAYRNGRMTLEINRFTHLPEAVEVTRAYPDDLRRGPFGDVTVRFDYGNWNVETDGFFYPRQQRVFVNGELLRDVVVGALTLGAPAPSDSFVVSDSGRALYAIGLKTSPRVLALGDRGTLPAVAPGIERVRDLWSMTAVRQDDGIVLFEAHISDRYVGQVIADVEKKWAPLKVKAVVMTSDPWAHIGGVREVVARGIPIYVSSLSIPFLKGLLATKHALSPDNLSKAPRVPKFVAVAGKVSLGTGVNRIELYPVGGPYAEHMTMAYFPALKLLYGADLVFPAQPPGPPNAPPPSGPPTTNSTTQSFSRPSALDLRRAVQREGLAVDTVFCVQPTVPPVAWSNFLPAGMTP